jgi:hypothetical protein
MVTRAVGPWQDEAGPIAMSPGSYKLTTVQPSDGRVHPVRCAQVWRETKKMDSETTTPALLNI